MANREWNSLTGTMVNEDDEIERQQLDGVYINERSATSGIWRLAGEGGLAGVGSIIVGPGGLAG